MSEVEVELIKQDVGCMASLKRISSPMQALATTITVTSVMTGVVPLTQLALGAGGPVVMVFGFALVCTMTITIALSLADMASGFPNVKGGLIEYSRRLAPPHLKRISSWTVGWLHFSAFATAATSCAFAIAVFGTAALQILTGVAPERWVTVLIHVIVSVLFGVFNAYRFNVDFISVLWHVLGPLIIVVTIAASSKTPPPVGWVLTHFENQTGWSSSFYVTLLGLMLGSFTMTGYDAPIHTMHSIEDAAVKVPRGIIFGFLTSFVIGEIIIVTLLFGISDIRSIVNPGISGIAAIEIFCHLIGTSGVICIVVIFMGTFFLCGQGVLKACSEIGHELALSGAFPKSEYLSKVGSKGQPARVGWLCVLISCAIGLIYLGNTTILQAMTSAVAMELNLVYTTPVALRLFFPSPTRFQSGPFSLGRWRRPVAVVAIFWAVLCVFIFSLPGFHPITADNMNYASVLLIITLSLILGYWFFSARKWFDLDRPSTEETANTEDEGGMPLAVRSEGPLREKDLDEIESWLNHLERDLQHLGKAE